LYYLCSAISNSDFIPKDHFPTTIFVLLFPIPYLPSCKLLKLVGIFLVSGELDHHRWLFFSNRYQLFPLQHHIFLISINFLYIKSG